MHALETADGRAVTRKLASGGVSCVFRARQAVSDRHGSLQLGAPEPDEGILRANFERWVTICASPVYRTCLCSAIDPADLRQALWQAGGKNDAVDACACCEAVLRRGHALRAGQERGATSGVDAAQSRGLPIRQQTIDASTPCAGICRSLA